MRTHTGRDSHAGQTLGYHQRAGQSVWYAPRVTKHGESPEPVGQGSDVGGPVADTPSGSEVGQTETGPVEAEDAKAESLCEIIGPE